MTKLLAKIQQEPTTFLFRKMWRFSQGRRHKVALALVMFVFSNSAALLTPFLFGEILTSIQNDGISEANVGYLMLLLVSIVGAGLLFWLFHGYARVLERTNAFYINEAYKNYLLRGVVDLDMSWHADHDSGDTIDKINKGTDGLYKFAASTFRDVEIFWNIVGPVAILYFYSSSVSLAVLAFTIGSIVTLFQFDRRLIPQYRELNKLENRIEAKIFDALSNITTVKILSISAPILRSIAGAIRAPFTLFVRNSKLNEWKWFTGSVLFDLVIVLPLAYFILSTYLGNALFEVGAIGALYLYLRRMSEAFFGFADHYEQTMIRKARVQNVAPIEELFAEKNTKRKKLSSQWKKLRIEKLDFTHSGGDTKIPHLSVDTLSFAKGAKIAFIGESGSGKTTFLSVLHGLFSSASAELSFDNEKARTVYFSRVRLGTMLVPQEPEVFSSNIRENITLGLDYSDKEVKEMTDLAQFTKVVDELPEGLKSVINEKGVNLSGGQKQRLALARALLFAKNKDIILLDESTSSVDPTNEALIYQNIFKRFKKKTVLASIHKLNLLKYFDRIVIFDKGSIVADGTFDELLKTNDAFRESWAEYTQENE